MGTTAEAVHEAQVRERFDAWSTSATFRHLKPWLAFIQRQVLDRIDWARTTAVLDIACGAGLAVDEAARRLHGRGLACGCDLSEGMLRQRVAARDRGAADVAFAAASAQNLPYRDGSFDAVICTVAFHHFPDPVAALGEMRRVLRSGGQALIVDPCRDLSLSVWVWDRLHRWFEPGHVEYYRTEDLRELFARAGFEAIEVMPLKPSYAAVRKLVRAAGLFVGTAPAADAGRGSSAGAVTPDDTSTAVASGRDPGPAEVGVDPRLLKILVCPLTKGPLRYDRERHELISERAGLAYPIRDGIPVLLAEGHLTP